MGFPRDQCEACLRAAFFNGDRAVEYLLGGIPEGLESQPARAHPVPGQAPGPGGPVNPAAGLGDLSEIANNPMFEQIRERIIQDPAFFQ